MYLRFADLPKRWIAGEEPRLDVHWARAAGMFSARVTVTPDELRRIQEELEVLLGPYLTRDPADAHSPAAAFAC